jgi:hypothetical protein
MYNTNHKAHKEHKEKVIFVLPFTTPKIRNNKLHE